MKLRPLIIDDEVRSQLASLVRHAEKNVFSMDDLLDIYNGRMTPAGDMEGFSRNLPFGYRVVYSIEEQPAGRIGHLSVSVDEDDKLPNVTVVKEIMKLVGFTRELEDSVVWMEHTAPNRQAVNVSNIIYVKRK